MDDLQIKEITKKKKILEMCHLIISFRHVEFTMLLRE